MKLKVSHPASGDELNELDVLPSLDEVVYRQALVHQVVTAYFAAARANTSRQKTRSEVVGSKSKPWRQKGSGRARAGSTVGPLWRGGGVTFASRRPCYEQKVNRKMYQGAIKSIFSELLKTGRLQVIDDIELTTHRTKDFLAATKALNLTDAIILVADFHPNLWYASRNLYHIYVSPVGDIDPVSLVGFATCYVTKSALPVLEERLK